MTVMNQQDSLNGSGLFVEQMVVVEQPRTRWRDAAKLACCSGQWKRHHEFTAKIAARAAANDGTTMGLHQLANHREAYA